MSPGNYAADITGFRFLQQRELPPVSTSYDYATADGFSEESARRLLDELPEDYELCFSDPERQHMDDCWVFVRRDGPSYSVMHCGHGWSSQYGPESRTPDIGVLKMSAFSSWWFVDRINQPQR